MKIRGKIGETVFSASIKVQDEKEISSRNGLREGDKSHCISLLRHHRPTGPLKIVPDNWPPFLFEWHLYPPPPASLPWNGANVVRVMITGGKLLEILCVGKFKCYYRSARQIVRIYNIGSD